MGAAMSFYMLLPLVACVVSAMLATAILARDSTSGASRLSATVLYGGAFWAFCEVLWVNASDPTVALWLVKLSALGWVMLGPLALHLVIEVTGEPAHEIRRILPRLYLASAAFLLLDWTTDLVHEGVVETPWGFSYTLGPAYPAFWLFTVVTMVWGLALGARAYRRLPSRAERQQACWVGSGILAPLLIASVSDGVLPFLGVHTIRLGTPTFIVLGATIAWSLHRYGYALLVPAAYAAEIVHTMHEGLVMLRLDGRIRTSNEAMARLAGCSRRALSGASFQDLFSCDLHKALETEGGLECEIRPLAGESFPVSISTSILRNRQGEAAGAAVVVRDERELVNLRKRLLLSGRMAAVGQLAAGIAHEINNPVAYVRANLVMLRQHWDAFRELASDALSLAGPSGPPGETKSDGRAKLAAGVDALYTEGQELIDESLEGVARTAAIVRGIREFSHAGSAVREPLDLNEIVGAAHRMAAPRLSAGIDVQLDYGDLPPFLGSAREVQQVVLNLLINAADALGESGLIRISTRKEGDFVRLAVSDDGSGIEQADIERIFDPFYTTKSVGEGTGLGLSISYEIVKRHGGEIAVDSTPGIGTIFRVRLPIERAAA